MTDTTVIPCMRPKVDVIPHPSNVAGAYQAVCAVPTCGWTYNSVKTACQEAATRHRGLHRDAVPTVAVKQLDSGRTVEQCQFCGWVTPVGYSTVEDRKRQSDQHLTEHHGLVTC